MELIESRHSKITMLLQVYGRRVATLPYPSLPAHQAVGLRFLISADLASATRICSCREVVL
jgi:hypothetical protein